MFQLWYLIDSKKKKKKKKKTMIFNSPYEININFS